MPLTDKQKRVLVQKVLPYTRHLSGQQLADPIRKAISLTYQDADIQEAGVHLAETIDRNLLPTSGADDLQLPAISKLPPLVACYHGSDTLMEALDTATPAAPAPDNLAKARKGSRLDGPGAGDTFGRTCYLHEAMPVIFHILSHARSYTEAIRANIQCGGDSCGRAWIIGPAMAAIHGIDGERGVPLSWVARASGAPVLCRNSETLINKTLETS